LCGGRVGSTESGGGLERQAEGVVNFPGRGLERRCAPKHGDRFFGVAGLDEYSAQIVIRGTVVGLDRNGSAEESGGVVDVTGLVGEHAEKVHRQRVGLASEDLAINALRLNQATGGVMFPSGLQCLHGRHG
jgi:hypothetical protein